MKVSLILLTALLLQSGFLLDLSEYSIDTLLEFLQSNEYYNMLELIKIYYGNDVAIAMCKEFVKSNHCNSIINIYIPTQSKARAIQKKEIEIDNNFQRPTFEYIIFNPKNHNIYNKDFKPIEIHKIISKIKLKFNIP